MKIYIVVEPALRDHEIEQIVMNMLSQSEYVYLSDIYEYFRDKHTVSESRVRKILNKLKKENKIRSFRIGHQVAFQVNQNEDNYT